MKAASARRSSRVARADRAGSTSDLDRRLLGHHADPLRDCRHRSRPSDIDGLSIAPTLLGRPGTKTARISLLGIPQRRRAQAVRFGDWKAVRNNVTKAPDATPELYNLADDPSETTNLADNIPTWPPRPPPT